MPELTRREKGKRVYPAHKADGRTKQSFKDETNINKIMAAWNRTGAMTHINHKQPSYGDFTNAPDYLEACTRIQAAQDQFAALPSAIRRRMGNDPACLIDFLSKSDNMEEAIKLGLCEAPTPATVATKPVAEPDADPDPNPPPQAKKRSGPLTAPVTGGE